MTHTNEEEFVKTLLDGQPEPPNYFAVMKRVNKEGPALLKELPDVQELDTLEQVKECLENGQIVDTRPFQEFAKGHIEGTLHIPFQKSFANWAGWIVDYNRPLHILSNPEELDEILLALHSVGIDNVTGFIDSRKLMAISEASTLGTIEEVTPLEIAERVEKGEVHVVDVRNLAEWNEGHIPDAQHIMLGTLAMRLDEIPHNKPILVQCRSGARSAMGASILKANGFQDVLNLSGGIMKWQIDGLALEDRG